MNTHYCTQSDLPFGTTIINTRRPRETSPLVTAATPLAGLAHILVYVPTHVHDDPSTSVIPHSRTRDVTEGFRNHPSSVPLHFSDPPNGHWQNSPQALDVPGTGVSAVQAACSNYFCLRFDLIGSHKGWLLAIPRSHVINSSSGPRVGRSEGATPASGAGVFTGQQTYRGSRRP